MKYVGFFLAFALVALAAWSASTERTFALVARAASTCSTLARTACADPRHVGTERDDPIAGDVRSSERDAESMDDDADERAPDDAWSIGTNANALVVRATRNVLLASNDLRPDDPARATELRPPRASA